MSYASVAEFRERKGTAASDAEVQAALDYATAVIEARTGLSYGTAAGSRAVFDVRSDVVVLDDPFSDVTEVRVAGRVLPESAYEVTPWGIRLTGAPYLYAGQRGPTVTVTASFGGAVPSLVKEAAILIAADRLGVEAAGASVVPDLPANVRSFSVEGLSVTFGGENGDVPGSESTGNAEADRLLQLVVGRRKSGVV